MSSVLSPYGLRVKKLVGDLPFSGGTHTYPLFTNQAQGFFFGDPVGLSAGNPIPFGAAPAVGSVIGVFMGAEWNDPVRGFVNAQYLPPNAISNGATRVKLKIADYPWQVMQVQADGSVTAQQIGLNAAIANFAAGSIITGNSQVQLTSASIAAATNVVRIYDFVYDAVPSPGAGSMPGDAYTDVLVIWNFGYHKFLNATGA